MKTAFNSIVLFLVICLLVVCVFSCKSEAPISVPTDETAAKETPTPPPASTMTPTPEPTPEPTPTPIKDEETTPVSTYKAPRVVDTDDPLVMVELHPDDDYYPSSEDMKKIVADPLSGSTLGELFEIAGYPRRMTMVKITYLPVSTGRTRGDTRYYLEYDTSDGDTYFVSFQIGGSVYLTPISQQIKEHEGISCDNIRVQSIFTEERLYSDDFITSTSPIQVEIIRSVEDA